MKSRVRFALACFLALTASFAHADTAPLPILSWGSYGDGPGQFYQAQGLAVDRTGRVYVTDLYSNRVQVFSRTGNFLFQWGGSGSGNGQFQQPNGVAVDTAGNVYVTDSNNRVQKFTGEGEYITQWGVFGTGPGEFSGPAGIATDDSGHVFVVETYNARVQKFTDTGDFLAQWGGYGGGPGEFANPNGIATDPDGNVYVTDTYNYRVQKFDNAGAFLTQWGSYGNGEGQFSWPIGIAADDSAVYVVEQQNHRAQKFSHDGTFILKWGSAGGSFGRFSYPYGVALDDSSNVYITDSSYRVQKFGRRTTTRISVPGNFSTIAQAIGVAGFGDTIVVDPGVYYEQVNTQGKAMVLASRFIDTGDPADIDNTVIDGQGYGTPLTFSNNEDANTQVIGFTLRNGQSYYGGGIACHTGSPRLEHLIVRGNGAVLGGGVYVGFGGSAPEFLSCTIAGNRANSGGGIFNFSSSVVGTPTRRCNIYDNRNTSGLDLGADLYGQGYASAVYVDTFTTTRFDEAQVYPNEFTTIDALHSYYPEISAHDIYVSPSGDNGNDGLTPGSALRNIFAAILRAAPLPGDSTTIHVAAGFYSPSTNEERTLHPRSFVSVAGENSGNTIVDGNAQIGMVYCVQDSAFELSNLTFQNGIIASGAIHLERSSPRITGCIIRGHIANFTGLGDAGIYCVNASNPTIQECTFTENNGPGISCQQSSHATIRNNQFLANVRGGVTCGSGSSPRIEGNTIIGAAQGYGSGIELQNYSNAWIYGNTIVGNSAPQGGGIAVSLADPVIRGNTLLGNISTGGYGDTGGGGIWCAYSNAVIDSNRFEGNRAIGSAPNGGAIFCQYQSPTITRNTFVDNVAQDTVGFLFAIGRGGAIFIQGSNPVIGGGPGLGNTFSGNFATVGADLYWSSTFVEGQHTPIAAEAHHPSQFVTPAPVVAPTPAGFLIDASFNHFRVYPATSYYVTPLYAFNLSDGSGDVAPFSEDAYVSPTGDDGNAGTSPGSPLRTIQSALSRMLVGSTPLAIHLAAGTYSPSVTGENFPLPMSSQVSLRGEGSRESILDAEGTATVLVLDGVTDVTVSGLRIQGGKAGAGGGVFCRASACSLLENTIRGNAASLGGGIYCTQGGAAIVANNQIVMNRASGPNYYARVGGGVAANDHANIELTNNVIALNIAGDQGGGMVIWNQSTAKMVNNTVAFNLANGNGAAINIFDSPVEIRNSILHSNVSGDGSQIMGGGANVTYSNVEGGWPGTGNLNVDPLFDEMAFLHLGPGSPCIDAGDPTATENDPEDPKNPGMALLPALGTVLNDMGAFGGPGAGGIRGDTPTPTMVSLTSASAGPEGVMLTWYGVFGMFSDVVVQRRALMDTEWAVLGPATVDGTGAISFVDTDVAAGATFIYRLEYQMGGIRQVTDEVLIRIPAASQFALRGLRPNPAVGEMVVDFTLPARESARIELLDITGRRVLAREVGELGAGRHLVELGRAERLAPGLYFLRLQQGGRFKTAKAIVAR